MAEQPPDGGPNSSSSPQPPLPDLPDGSIHLKVKVPHGNLPPSVSTSTFSLGAVPVTTTIGAVRQQIQQTIPTNPAPARQRLLYGGRALYEDSETVQDALHTRRNAEQREYVVHLIVRGGEASAASRTASPAPANNHTSSRPGSTAHPFNDALNQQRQRIIEQRDQLQAAQAQQAQHGAFNHAFRGMAPNVRVPPGGLDPGQALGLAMEQRAMQQAHQQPDQTPQPNEMDGRNAATSDTLAPEIRANGPTQTDGAHQQTQPQQQGNPSQPEIIDEFTTEVRGPNGERLQYRQHTFHHPHGDQPGHGSAHGFNNNSSPAPGQPGHVHGMPHNQPFPPGGHQHFGFPGMPPGMTPMPGMPQVQFPPFQMGPWGVPMAQLRQGNTASGNANPQADGRPSALDQARSNLAEMRRMLDNLRNAPQDTSDAADTTGGERSQTIEQIEQRMRDVEQYINPFGVGARSQTPNASAANGNTPARGLTPSGPANLRPNIPIAPALRMRVQQRPPQADTDPGNDPTNPENVTAYLLSGPQGPRAIVYSPQYGTYTSHVQPSATRTQHQAGLQNVQQQHQPQDQADPVVEAAAQALARRDQGIPDPLGPLQPILGHFWLLFRILIFAYFLLGSDMGWSKIFMLAGIGFAFWGFRLGVLDNPEVLAALRRWWEGVVGVPERPREQGVGQNGQQGAQGQQGQNGDQNVQQPAPAGQDPQHRQPGRMPTPEEVAQRLLNDQAVQNRGWLREQLRPLERALALFVASLWPGIGEAHVRAQREAREAEERRQQEAEVEARRRAEEENKEGESEKEKVGESSSGGGASEPGAEGVKTEGAGGSSGPHGDAA